ncbi:dienelactone hydrolase family protein [Jatrophihabitans telluris]|uniref:Dienelactone hydrolase family protein n=1 Tax=Jatrophihabitans telluris TaxID=2038343 RepID=A0ABY4QVI4_9ACTN|nr:dienelactone hydrolase family protein [Jatrophihabitans telluris]UQX87505.1 dienelactone hydrolase family protein [Jatrophihabitans telluris]
MTDAITTASIRLSGAGGDEIEAYQARPAGPEPRGGVVVIHHLPGFDRWSKEVARRFAVDGYDVLVPNLYWREAPGAEPDDAAAVGRAQGGVPDERVIGDVAGAVEYLRGLPTSNGKVGVIGHCSGGRQAVLVACNLELDAAVDCYGAYVVGTPPPDFVLKVTGLENQLGNLSAPLLGLFGNDDGHPSASEVNTLDGLLTELGKEHEFHRYEGAGHAFFATDRPSYRVEAALDGYQRIGAFFGRTLN